ncbi:MAG: DUF4352 domain-containing protein [Leptospiraceae bacterium]|nr:DUF4352 domain-containing protein [Leptospiraceae bacterium]
MSDQDQSIAKWKFFVPFYGIYAIFKAPLDSKGKWYATSIVSTIIFLFVVMNSGEKSEKVVTSSTNQPTTSAEKEKPQEEAKKVPKVGEVLKTEKFEITVVSVKERNQVGGQFLKEKPAEGALFIAVTMKVKNISSKPVSSFSQPRLKLIDPSGNKYDDASAASVHFKTEIESSGKTFSDINPGITVKLGEVFEVAKELWKKNKGWKLLIDADDNIEIPLN